MPVRSGGSGLAAAASRKTPPPAETRPAPAPAQEPLVDDADRPIKFTAVLDQATVTRFERVTDDMRKVGRLAAGRYPSRADVLRAVIALVDDNPDLAEQVRQRVAADLTERARH